MMFIVSDGLGQRCNCRISAFYFKDKNDSSGIFIIHPSIEEAIEKKMMTTMMMMMIIIIIIIFSA